MRRGGEKGKARNKRGRTEKYGKRVYERNENEEGE